MRSCLLLLAVGLGGCNLGAGGEQPDPVVIDAFAASPSDVGAGETVSLSWRVDGPSRKLVLAIGDCGCAVDGDSFEDRCDQRGGCDCPCGAAAPGEVLYTLSAIGPEHDETADVATAIVTVR